MSIAFVAGTTAELIKLAPVLHGITERGGSYELWYTAQHVGSYASTLDDLGLEPTDVHLIPQDRQRQLVSAAQVPGWASRIALTSVRRRRDLRFRLVRDGRRPLVIVHGDTFTTVLGALLGRLLGADVAHVEAGMRSGRLMHPLPEELNRRAVARLVQLHFAPGAREVAHLRRERVRGRVVDTGANTAVDALKLMSGERRLPMRLPDEFGLLTIHRFEMLRNNKTFSATLRTLREASRDLPVLMPAGATERARIEELGLAGLFDDRFRLIEKQPYARFVSILSRASFVVTDSGGLQQECGFLGLPCAVHREATESQHGIGENLVLTGLDDAVLRDFLENWRAFRRPASLDAFQPTNVVLDTLEEGGYLAAAQAERRRRELP